MPRSSVVNCLLLLLTPGIYASTLRRTLLRGRESASQRTSLRAAGGCASSLRVRVGPRVGDLFENPWSRMRMRDLEDGRRGRVGASSERWLWRMNDRSRRREP